MPMRIKAFDHRGPGRRTAVLQEFRLESNSPKKTVKDSSISLHFGCRLKLLRPMGCMFSRWKSFAATARRTSREIRHPAPARRKEW